MAITLHLLPTAAIILSLIHVSSSISNKTISDASEVLTDSGFTSIALMVEFVSPKIQNPKYPSVTIFSPPDTSFERSGQPSLSTFKLHLVPLASTFDRLKALPTGSRIATMSGNLLISTSSNQIVSVNGVKVNRSPLFNNGFLVIYSVDDFFDPNFVFSTSNPNSTAGCLVPGPQGSIPRLADLSFAEASEVLRSRGYAVVASFLDMQLMLGFKDQTTKLTVMAPVDEVMETLVGNVADLLGWLSDHFDKNN